MITYALLMPIVVLLELFNMLPNWDEATQAFEALGILINYTMLFDGLLPVATIWQAIGVIISWHAAMWIGHLGVSFVNWIRGAGEIRI